MPNSEKRDLVLDQFDVEPLSVPDPWNGCLLPVNGFPLESAAQGRLFARISKIAEPVRDQAQRTRATWLQMHAFPADGSAARLLTEHGRKWMPSTGLGVFPDREPPRLWKGSDFTDRKFSDPLPELMYVVFHVSSENAASHAWENMFGTGSSIHLVLGKSAEQFHLDVNAELSAHIEEEAFKNQPFYFPLLEARSLRRVNAEDLDRWLSGALLYVRESIEDKAVLLLARSPYGSVITDLG